MKFEVDDIMKNEIYLFSDYIIKRKNRELIILTIYNKYILFANNSI